MEYGCIGEKLGHSFSTEIHALLSIARQKAGGCGYTYELRELSREALPGFFRERKFCGINVTIPYKREVFPYLDEISPMARRIGAVNTIVNRNGRLYGYNTDAYGLKYLLTVDGINPQGKKVLIFGSGGTARTAAAVMNELGARDVLVFSRDPERADPTPFPGGARLLPYADLAAHRDAGLLVNATPAGMFPDDDGCPLPAGVSLADFPALTGAVDAIYHPARTCFLQQAAARGVPATGGLAMLVAQAAQAARLFSADELMVRADKRCCDDWAIEAIPDVCREMRRRVENIVLIGLPGCGKSTVGRLIADRLGRELLDSDELVAKTTGRTPAAWIRSEGEEAFRRVECEVIRSQIAARTGVVIATGGGAVIKEENVRRLARNGQIFWLSRSLEALRLTLSTAGEGQADRPLLASADSLSRLWQEREALYRSAADVEIFVPDGESAEETAARVIRAFEGIF